MTMIVRILVLMLLATNAYGASTAFRWNPHPPEQAVQGFKVYCGSAPGRYDMSVAVPDPKATSHPVNRVVSKDGEYYCSLTAYNAAGESEHSSEVRFVMAGGVVADGDTVIVDNRSSDTTRVGTWTLSTGSKPWGADSVYSDAGGKFRWTPAVPSPGSYRVYAWWTYHANRSTKVPYRVRHESGTSTVVVNQRDAGLAGRWVSLGTFRFSPASGHYVEVSSENGQASADAIKLEVAPAESGSLTVDNRDGNTASSGVWQLSTGTNAWRADSVYSDRGATFRWLPSVPEAGHYRVYAWWTYHANRSTKVPYRVRHASGTSTVHVNQRDQTLAGRWVALGTYQFAAGNGGYVEVSSENGQASADAIKLEPAGSAPSASEVVMDNRSAGTTRTGTWYASTSAGYWNVDSLYSNLDGTFRWTPELSAPGTYEVYAWWTRHSNRSTKVPYRIRHASGTATVLVNQRDLTKAGKWIRLGTYTLDPATAYVEVSSENGQASADAVRFVPAP